MKAYILNGKAREIIDRDHAAYNFPPASWHPAPETLFEFDDIYAPYIIKQETPYDPAREWFDAAYVLQTAKDAKRKLFKTALGEIDYRCTRSAQDITARSVEISMIEDDLAKVSGGAADELHFLRDELREANRLDGLILAELRQIAESNRIEQQRLMALEIADDMTLEQAQTVILEIANAKPWLPWTTEPALNNVD